MFLRPKTAPVVDAATPPPTRLPWLFASVCLLLTFLPFAAAEEASPDESSLRLLRVDEPGGEKQAVKEGGTLPRAAQVVFEVNARTGGDYLYLLQQRGDELRILLPAAGLGWVKAEGAESVVPPAPDARDPGTAATSWTADHTGALNFILVAAQSPRAVPSDGHLDSLERFLLPPPYVTGAAAAPAQVIARTSVEWLEGVEDK